MRRLQRCARPHVSGSFCSQWSILNLVRFRDESQSISRRVATGEAGPSSNRTSTPRRSSPDRETRALSFFFEQFVNTSYLSSLEGLALDDFLSQPVLACALHVLAERQGADPLGLELARQRYVDAIHRTNIALRSPQSAKQDSSLIAVLLLSTFERLTWDTNMTRDNWTQHVKGLALILQLRGREQLDTRHGAALFRDIQSDMVCTSWQSISASLTCCR